jgi:hypothetical protein
VLDREGDEAGALAAYRSFVEQYPASSHLAVAMERIRAIEDAASELFEQVRSAPDQGARLARCKEYLRRFPDGPMAAKVEAILDETVGAMERREAEARALAALKADWDDDRTLALGRQFLVDYPESPDRQYVEWRIETARRNVEQRTEEERSRIGRPQRIAGIAIIGGGALIAGLGGVFAGLAKSDYDDLKQKCEDEYDTERCPPDFQEGAKDDIRGKALAADILFGVGAAAVVAGVITLVRAPSWEKQQEEGGAAASVAVAPTGDGRGAVLGVAGSW